MNYGFVIDNRTCIGCHACSTACKSENEVPLGVYRTWVKYTDVGRYPDVTRRFQVTRCNHCENAPCVRICPVQAMYQREDGIVDFDHDECIACKSCIQACPYDSIHIDPETNTAAKCNFCAHRVEEGREPSCVVVCPTHSIIAGDLEDPTSEISKVLGKNKVSVRKPEQGTGPKLFYIDGDSISLNPTAANQTPESYMWADMVSETKFSGVSDHAPSRKLATKNTGETIRIAGSQGVSNAGNVPSMPVYNPDCDPTAVPSDHMVQVAYTAQHKIHWKWQVPAYLVTKGLGAGPLLILCMLFLTGITPFDQVTTIISSTLGLIFIGITTLFLIFKLGRPERFLRIVLRPQFKSWLTRGAFLLIGYSNLLAVWWLLELANYFGYLPGTTLEMVRPWFMYITIPLAFGATVYTAFLFSQAEGRDLWQSSALPLHMLLQGIMCGAALLMVVGEFGGVTAQIAGISKNLFLGTLILDLLFQAFEFGMSHGSEVAARAAHEIVGGEYKYKFWGVNIVLGHFVAIGLLFVGGPLSVVAAVLAMVGLYYYEYCFIIAPQRIPNS